MTQDYSDLLRQLRRASDPNCPDGIGVAWSLMDQAGAAIEALQSRLDTVAAQARERAIRECWDAINAHIKTGPLPGNGWDKSAERNGMVLATNLLFDLMAQENGNAASASRGVAG